MPKYIHTAKPCISCPFRRDADGVTPIRLYRARIIEIASAVAPANGQGGGFPCHKTVDHDERDPRRELECAGALIFAYKQGEVSQLVRIMERMGGIDRELAEGEHPDVFDSIDEMLATALDNPKRAAGRRRKK